MQVPLFLHGFLRHSLTSVSQNVPVNPARHSQDVVLSPSMQTPLFIQMLSVGEQDDCISQVSPAKESGQEQINLSVPSSQVPLFWHGLGLQLSMLILQFSPVKPGAQMQE